MKKITVITLFFISSFSFVSAQDSNAEVVVRKHIGVGEEAPHDATILFDGSRAMLDENWTYWDGPGLAAELPVKWAIEDNPEGEGTVMNSDDPSAAGGLYGSADIVTKQKLCSETILNYP